MMEELGSEILGFKERSQSNPKELYFADELIEKAHSLSTWLESVMK